MGNISYPIFCGKVVRVSEIVTIENNNFTIVRYLQAGDEPQLEQAQAMFLESLFDGVGVGELGAALEQRVRRADIPMRLDPSVIEGADIRARFAELIIDGEKCQTYEVEVIKGRMDRSQSVLVATGLNQPRHTGFKYVQVVRRK